jgi:rhomboid family GlyGly-CTERM serine protease
MRPLFWRIELWAFAVLIGLLNLLLLTGGFPTTFIFLPDAVRAGEWWRVFTHPFVHVSLYHLLLDASAFFLLYTELRDKGRYERFALLLAAGAGSLLVSLWAAPMIQTRGLCGLSGIAHGLAAVSALEMMRGAKNKTLWRLGLASLLLVVGKSLVEAVTGHIALEWLHFGQLGFPIAVCHAGGVLGALLVWIGVSACRQRGAQNCQTNASVLVATSLGLNSMSSGTRRVA